MTCHASDETMQATTLFPRPSMGGLGFFYGQNKFFLPQKKKLVFFLFDQQILVKLTYSLLRGSGAMPTPLSTRVCSSYICYVVALIL